MAKVITKLESTHALVFKTADKRDLYFVSVTGIVKPLLKNHDGNQHWNKKTVETYRIRVKLPVADIPKPRSSAKLHLEHWTVYAGLNEIYDDGYLSANFIGVKNSGHSVGSFKLATSDISSGWTHLDCNLGVSGFVEGKAGIIRIGFKVNMLLHYA